MSFCTFFRREEGLKIQAPLLPNNLDSSNPFLKKSWKISLTIFSKGLSLQPSITPSLKEFYSDIVYSANFGEGEIGYACYLSTSLCTSLSTSTSPEVSGRGLVSNDCPRGKLKAHYPLFWASKRVKILPSNPVLTIDLGRYLSEK